MNALKKSKPRERRENCSVHRCPDKATHLGRHGVYRGLPLCGRLGHHEGPTSSQTGGNNGF